MRHLNAATLVLMVLVGSASGGTPTDSSFDWAQWRALAVQDGGRYKPLDTMAWETLRALGNRTSFVDPETGERLDGIALYLTMLLEWPGWEPAPAAGAPPAAASPHAQPKLDKWDQAPLLRVDYLALRKALGMADDQKYLSPAELARATLRDPQTGRQTSFLLWTMKLRRQQEDFATLERKALELADNYWSYQAHRSGRAPGFVPDAESTHEEWWTLASLMRSEFTEANDPTGALRKAKAEFKQLRAAYKANAPEEFNAAAARFIALLREFGPQLGTYPTQATLDLEVAYNHWAPFRFAWIFTSAALVCMLLSMATGWRGFYAGGIVLVTAGLVAMTAGFAIRIGISGRAPVTDMYESVVYLGLGAAVFGLVFEWFHRKKYVLSAAAAVATIALILADNSPAILDPSLRPLQPVLRNNFWLVVHVMTITLSYAAFALALGIGNVTLGHYLVRSGNFQAIKELTKFTYRILQVGLLLLAAGTILGAVWAAYAWGRFWGWDPKEVWALITLLGYIGVLHARYVGWVKERGLAALSVVCFSLVIMAWYGVNFLQGSGLHSYGFGSGGQEYVFGALAVQLLYVGIALVASSMPAGGAPVSAKTPETADAASALESHAEVATQA